MPTKYQYVIGIVILEPTARFFDTIIIVINTMCLHVYQTTTGAYTVKENYGDIFCRHE